MPNTRSSACRYTLTINRPTLDQFSPVRRQAIKLHRRIGEDLDAAAAIERNYEKEIRLVFGASRAAPSN